MKHIYILRSNLGYTEYFSSYKKAFEILEHLEENHKLKEEGKPTKNRTYLINQNYVGGFLISIEKMHLNIFKI